MWEFHASYDGRQQRWLWKYFLQGILRQTSDPGFTSMTDALSNAREHGFEKHVHRWQVFAN